MKVIKGKYDACWGYNGYIKKLKEELTKILPEKRNTEKINWRGKEIIDWNWWVIFDADNHLKVELYDKTYEKDFIKICKKFDVDLLWIEYYG